MPLAVLPVLASPASASTEASQTGGAGKYPHAVVVPNVLETSHASRETAAPNHAYYTAKSRYDIDAFIDFFTPGQMAYFDSPVHIGGVFPTRDVFRDQIMGPTLEGWSKTGGKSYPLRVIGDATSAVVLIRNTAELFGNEVRIISSFTFEHGKIVRVVDYWDGRRNDEALKNRPPNTDNPRTLGTEIVRVSADPAIKTFARHLGSALAAGDVDSAEALFSDDALFEDMTTRTTIVGRPAIGRYLTRALPKLPYGPGSELPHVLGSKQGGWL
ncbi:nuclear transport factor 2 family protein [Streptomyces sp. NRRL F-525]|uniref:nuclear transport factor 2 family protein n=1 Tax=Streptomyces sp. NRRL F-525 TaxID=1463861 RepID=UPI00068C044C|nr:nuclear transport factor 2 family protein [Streptomyces sp. NRRL F-525]